MRYVQRDPSLEPSLVGSFETRDTIRELLSAVGSDRQIRQEVFALRDRIQKDARRALREQFKEKCAYCESNIVSDFGEVDWFRPVAGARRANGSIDQDHYFWLVGTWDNLFQSCAACARYKANSFPAKSKCGIGTSLNQLRRQREGILLDPCWDHPEHHFMIGAYGELLPRNTRAETTISILDLNRDLLCQGRLDAISSFLREWRYTLSTGDPRYGTLQTNGISEELHHGREYVGAIYIYLWQISNRATQRLIRPLIDNGPNPQILRRMLQVFGSLPDLADITTLPLTRTAPRRSGVERFTDRFLPISRVTITNFKGIRSLVLDFRDAKDNRHAIVGENAAGKTTVLQAISLGLAGPKFANTYLKDVAAILPDDADAGSIEVKFVGTDESNVLEFSRASRRFHGRVERRVKVYGYGPYRILAKQGLGRNKRDINVRLHSLFEDGAKLNGFHGWLDTLRPAQRKDLGEVLRILLSSRDTEVAVDAGSLQITTNGQQHPVQNLSSGMQSVVSLCTDVLEAVYAHEDSILRGDYVVLVDELDAHLHPAWRVGIANRLAKALPNAQLIFSTHDPLCLRGLDSDQVHILARDGKGQLQTKPARYSDSLDVDQVLTSPVFGLFSTHTPEWEEDYYEYCALLSAEARGELDQRSGERLRVLTQELDRHYMLGTTKRERLIYAVIDSLMERDRVEVDEWDPAVIASLADAVQKSLVAANGAADD